MQSVKELVKGVAVKQVIGNDQILPIMLAIDSREISTGGLFFAIKGTRVDGHEFIEQAVKQGASVVVCEQLPEQVNNDVCFVVVEDSAKACGLITAAFYHYPSKSMKVVGVTGTNGKTTIATLLFRLFRTLGYDCGLLSTVQNQINETVIPATHTTPDAVHLQKLLAQMNEAGCTYVFMEVSSIAVDQQRIAGIEFTGAIFTNITHDHLDYHKTFDAYIAAKKKFFDDLSPEAFALSNLDERRGTVMLQNTTARKMFYAVRNAADFKGKVLVNDIDGLEMMIDGNDVHFMLSGLFNAYNLLAVFGAAVLCGQDKLKVLTALSSLKGAEGRFETYRSDKEKILGIVDYAHTPDALLNVLLTIKNFDSVRQLITVVGAGGDRDKTKRPEMAEIACKHSDKVILTSDNPRTENPEDILDDMERGLSAAHRRKMMRITDRKEAIKVACSMASQGSVVLISGKGHENYQEINGVKHHFSDREVLLEMFELLEK